jgi:putative transposase
MKYEFMDCYRSEFRMQKMAEALVFSRSAYYAWKKRGVSKRKRANTQLLEEIRLIHLGSRMIYGSRRIAAALRSQGHLCGKNRVASVMRNAGIVSKTKRKFKVTTHSRHTLPKAENLLRQDFKPEKLNGAWVSDITYIWTLQGWLYLAIILDMFSRCVVGWALGNSLHHSLVLQAFRQAVKKRAVKAGCIFHSDQGIQYACETVKEQFNRYGFIQSMSGKGNCYDNAFAESFFHSLKTEWVYFEKYQTKEQAKLSIFEYIELFYNRHRKHSSLGYLSPVEYERLHS